MQRYSENTVAVGGLGFYREIHQLANLAATLKRAPFQQALAFVAAICLCEVQTYFVDKTERLADQLRRLATVKFEEDIQVGELAAHYQVARQTVYLDLATLKDQGLLQIENGCVEVVTTA